MNSNNGIFKPHQLASLLAASVLLSACGSGGNSNGGNSTDNQAPSISVEQTVQSIELETITIAATASDSDGSVASYQWTQVSGINLALQTTNEANLTIDLPDVNQDETVELQLTVTDNDQATATASVTLNIMRINDLPLASISDNVTNNIIAAKAFELNASGSTDFDGSVVAYNWQHIDGVPVNFSDMHSQVTQATAAHRSGETTVSLTVTDNEGGMHTIEKTYVVEPFYRDIQTTDSTYCALLNKGDNNELNCWNTTFDQPNVSNPQKMSLASQFICAQGDEGTVCTGNNRFTINTDLFNGIDNLYIGSNVGCQATSNNLICHSWVHDMLFVKSYTELPKVVVLYEDFCTLAAGQLKCFDRDYNEYSLPGITNPTKIARQDSRNICVTDQQNDVTCFEILPFTAPQQIIKFTDVAQHDWLSASSSQICFGYTEGITTSFDCRSIDEQTELRYNIPDIDNVQQIIASRLHTCVLSDQQLQCFGGVELPPQP